MKKVWLDDLRNPSTFLDEQAGMMGKRARNVLLKYARDNESWVWVKNVDEAKKEIEKGDVIVLSCDNDLGLGLEEGYNLINWLEEKAFTDKSFPIPKYIYAHTDNNARYESMSAAIKSIYKQVVENEISLNK